MAIANAVQRCRAFAMQACLTFRRSRRDRTLISVPGQPSDPENRYLTVGPGFFATMQIPILAGRDIEERDRRGSPAVAVINEAFARKNFGDRTAGAAFDPRQGWSRAQHGDVGVRSARYGLTAASPVVYFP
jgi:hypothetical protein